MTINEHATHFRSRADAERCADANNRGESDDPNPWTFEVRRVGEFWVVVCTDENHETIGAL